MPQHDGHSHSPPDARQPVRFGSLVLLVLLILLPVAHSLASPEPLHPVGHSPVVAVDNVHAHGPSEAPVCRHGGHEYAVPGLVADRRDQEIPASGEGSDKGCAAMPSQGPTTAFTPRVASVAPELLSIDADNDLPIYLLTQRFRV